MSMHIISMRQKKGRMKTDAKKEFMVPNFGVYTRLFVVKHLWLVYTMTNLLRIYFYRKNKIYDETR